MTYREILAHIYGLGRFGMKPGLERITALLHTLGNPHDSLRVVHLAGTNGKGSTASFLSSILSAAGLDVGLFTSPHLTSFTERIRINGAEITEDEVVGLAERVMAASPAGTTFFETVTAMAYLHFAEKGVGLAIMEVGMGGRFDATNAASGILSVITPISLDHCEYLGTTTAEIALEKAGIIKPGRPVVTSVQDRDALQIIKGKCRELGSPLFSYGESFTASWEDEGLAYSGMHHSLTGLKPGIAGRYQAGNTASALASAEILMTMGFDLPTEALKKGIERAFWPGRMELFGVGPRILLDGAHNPAGGEALAEALVDIPHERVFLVAGIMGDKDAGGTLGPLFPLATQIFAVSPSLERALPSAELAAYCQANGVPCRDAGSVATGLEQAKSAALPGDLIVVCGSLFTVGEARAILLSTSFEPIRG